MSRGLDAAVALARHLPPELAHRLTLAALSRWPVGRPRAAAPSLAQDLWGLPFPNPVGLAAGFDKDARAPDALLGLGFGFVEVGTLTPRPQAGNPRPRLFRLAEDRAVINRLGFNNDGQDAALRRLEARAGRPGILGINLGANRDSPDPIADYVAGLTRLGPHAAYVTINISSPNTPGLRDLQAPARLDALLGALMAARMRLARAVPLLVKIAPDLAPEALEALVDRALAHRVDGLIVSNTTTGAREGLRSPHARETGGLSGAPLFAPSTAKLSEAARLAAGRLVLVGVGGIATADEAYAKIRAGASLVQLYTGLVFGGPGLIRRLTAGLAALLARDGFAHVAEAVGADQPWHGRAPAAAPAPQRALP